MESSSSLVNILIMLTGIRKNYTHSYLKNKLKRILSLQRKERANQGPVFIDKEKASIQPPHFSLRNAAVSHCELKHQQTDSCKASKTIQMLPTRITFSAVANLRFNLNTVCWRLRENTWPQITLKLFLWQSSATLAWGSPSVLSKRWALLSSSVCKATRTPLGAVSQRSYVHVFWPGIWHTPRDPATACPFRCDIWSNSEQKQSGFSGKELQKNQQETLETSVL